MKYCILPPQSLLLMWKLRLLVDIETSYLHTVCQFSDSFLFKKSSFRHLNCKDCHRGSYLASLTPCQDQVPSDVSKFPKYLNLCNSNSFSSLFSIILLPLTYWETIRNIRSFSSLVWTSTKVSSNKATAPSRPP